MGASSGSAVRYALCAAVAVALSISLSQIPSTCALTPGPDADALTLFLSDNTACFAAFTDCLTNSPTNGTCLGYCDAGLRHLGAACGGSGDTYCDVVGTAGNSSSLPGYDFESGFCVPPACDSSWTAALTLAVNELIYQGAPIAPLSLQCGFTADTGSLLVPIAATCGSLAVVLAVCGFFYVRTHLAESGLDSATLLEGLHEEGGSVSSQDLDEEDTTRLVR